MNGQLWSLSKLMRKAIFAKETEGVFHVGVNAESYCACVYGACAVGEPGRLVYEDGYVADDESSHRCPRYPETGGWS